MNLSEADTKAKLIDPALNREGWTENLMSVEEIRKKMTGVAYAL